MNPNELIKVLENKLVESPENLEIKERLAFLLLSQGDVTRAENLLNEIIQVEPKSSNALWGLAKIYWQKSSVDEALSCMKKLSTAADSKLNKEQALTFAKILARKSIFNEASKWLDRAISLDSSLLHTENSFLKYIRQNLVISSSKGNDPKNINSFIPGGQALPLGKNSLKQSHYIVLEISHFIGTSMENSPFQPGGLQSANSDEFNENSSSETNNLDAEELIETEKDKIKQIKKLVTLDQVAGLKKIKHFLLQEIVLPLKNPELTNLCKSTSNPKVLLYGPPGCGKTYLCRALANETDINFLALRAGDFLDLSFEESELKLAHMLQFARENKPAVIFIDEYEWLGGDAEKLGLDAETAQFRSNLLNLLLDSINGNYFANGNIALIAITNKPWLLDQSFLMAGKIDKHIYVSAPSIEDKAEILKIAFHERSGEVTDFENLNFQKIAKRSKNIASGAEVEMFVESVISEVFLDKVLNSQIREQAAEEEILKNKTVVLTTDRLKRSIKSFNYSSSVDSWLKVAKSELTNKKNQSNLFFANRFWQSIKEYEIKRQGFLNRLINKMFSIFRFGA